MKDLALDVLSIIFKPLIGALYVLALCFIPIAICIGVLALIGAYPIPGFLLLLWVCGALTLSQ